jgi:hypothetical protein
VVEFHAYRAEVDVEFAVPLDATSIELRVIDDETGIASNIFTGSVDQRSATIDGNVQGFVWFDENGNGIFDSSESPDVSAVVRLLSSTGVPLPPPQVVAAVDFTAGSAIGILSSGVELQASASSLPTPSLSVADLSGALAFAYRLGAEPWTTSWTSTSPAMKVLLPEPHSYLAVEIAGSNSGGYGRITAYDDDHQLLTRVTSEFLAPGESYLASISATDSEIAYIVIEAHGPGGITIHAIQIGANMTAPVDAMGAYSLADFSPGVYKVAVASSLNEMTSPDRQVHVNPGTTLSNVNFALVVAPSWRNSDLLGDVDEDGWVTTLDIAYLVKEFRIQGTRSLAELPPIDGHLVDLDGDQYLTTLDLALLVSAFRNRQLPVQYTGQGEAESEAATMIAGAETATSVGENEGEYVDFVEAESVAAAPPELGLVGIVGGAVNSFSDAVYIREGRIASVAAPMAKRAFVAAVNELIPSRKFERASLLDACFDDPELWSPWDELMGIDVVAGRDNSVVVFKSIDGIDGAGLGI